MTATVPSTHYFIVAETAAAHLGLISARFLASTGWFAHEALILSILRQAYLIDPRYVGPVFDAYCIALAAECGAVDVLPPTKASVAHVLAHSVKGTIAEDSFNDEIHAILRDRA